MENFKRWLNENSGHLFGDGTDNLEFEGTVQAPRSLVFKVYKDKEVILDGAAIANPPKKFVRGDFSYFYIKCPQIGLSEWTTINNINSPIGNFIKDYVLMHWDFGTETFKNQD